MEDATFFALADDGTAVCLAGGYREKEDPGLFGAGRAVGRSRAPTMRSRPTPRGSRRYLGLGLRREELRLWVGGPRARALYEDSGFEPDGREQPRPHAPHVIETGMTRQLGG